MNDEGLTIGTNIAARICMALANKGIPFAELEKSVYAECARIAEESRKGDWLQFPNGTTYTLTFKPVKGVNV